MEKRRVNVRAIIWRDGKILAVKHKDEYGVASPYWATPGGGLDPLESLRDGVSREVYEELGVKAEAGVLLAVQQFHSERDGFDEELEFLFAVKDSPLFDEIDLSKTSHGQNELAEVAFIDPTTVPIEPDFLATLNYEEAIRTAHGVEVNNYL